MRLVSSPVKHQSSNYRAEEKEEGEMEKHHEEDEEKEEPKKRIRKGGRGRRMKVEAGDWN